MDEERFEAVAAQVLALDIVIGALVDLFPNPGLLREAIAEHAKAFLSGLPSETKEQRQYVKSVWRKLNAFSELLQEQG
jgi:hypothetical protein